jgi:hypothetical protein
MYFDDPSSIVPCLIADFRVSVPKPLFSLREKNFAKSKNSKKNFLFGNESLSMETLLYEWRIIRKLFPTWEHKNAKKKFFPYLGEKILVKSMADWAPCLRQSLGTKEMQIIAKCYLRNGCLSLSCDLKWLQYCPSHASL